jgi:hypothetical protein
MYPSVRAPQPNRDRLRQVLELMPAIQPARLNLATYYAVPRLLEAPPVGCVLGHFARAGVSPVISLKRINFCSELKTPMMADVLLDDYPLADWQHFTLHYHAPDVECFGLTAAMLFFNLRQWDVQRLFYPAGSSYELRPPLESLAFRLQQFVEAWPYAVQVGDLGDRKVTGDGGVG